MTSKAKEQIIESFSDLAEISEIVRKPVIDSIGRSYGTGKRKNAIARVWIKKGTGKAKVNQQDLLPYFGREILVRMVDAPFKATNNQGKFDVFATVSGGGKSGQAGALAHGISKALDAFDPDANHKILRSGDFLTRDSRVVERKKYGLKKARKGQTYRKR